MFSHHSAVQPHTMFSFISYYYYYYLSNMQGLKNKMALEFTRTSPWNSPLWHSTENRAESRFKKLNPGSWPKSWPKPSKVRRGGKMEWPVFVERRLYFVRVPTWSIRGVIHSRKWCTRFLILGISRNLIRFLEIYGIYVISGDFWDF